MLNLSDKELDRLSQEAASAYDPGEPAGAGSWDMLKVTLDKELGRVSPNPLRAIRRLPFYYAPALLLLVGVSYYFIKGRNNSRAAPTPASPVNPLYLTQNNSDKPNSTPYSQHPTDKTGDDKKGSEESAGANTPTPAGTKSPEGANASTGAKSPASASAPTPVSKGPAAADRPATVPGLGKASGSASASAHASTAPSGTALSPASSTAGVPSASSGSATASHVSPHTTAPGSTAAATVNGQTRQSGHSHDIHTSQQITTSHSGRHHDHIADHSGKDLAANQSSQQGKTDRSVTPDVTESAQQGTAGQPSQQSTAKQSGQPSTADQSAQHQVADPSWSVVRKPSSLTRPPVISDSALRKLTAKSAAANSPALINVGKKNNQSLHVDRSLQLGFNVAPDFSSVHSLAGDRPGSLTGITLDYQFVNRWYLGTGFLYSRRNYTARSEDYHVPPYYYQMNNMHDVNYIKGSFSMLEIPLNLRYDFSIAGNTVFFASAGASSYLLSKENCSYYYYFFGREAYRKFTYPVHHSPLFSVINLSMGVEAGISNSFSFLVAPYMKIPTSSIGFGQIQMNSIGVDFGLKYTPVLKRKRK